MSRPNPSTLSTLLMLFGERRPAFLHDCPDAFDAFDAFHSFFPTRGARAQRELSAKRVESVKSVKSRVVAAGEEEA
jgi:hypothetical protein